MKSIRAKITLLTVCAIVAAMSLSTILGVAAIKNFGGSSSRQMLLLLCQTGQKNLDSYFGSVQQSVEMVAAFAEADLTGLDAEQLRGHMERASAIFRNAAQRTMGVLTYYYRVDPAISETVRGFWYIKSDEGVFQEHAVTDITLYDTDDTSALVWFTVPKATGEALWLPPYVTDNLGVRVVSYNVPIYWNGLFVGVVGIEIDCSTMAEQVDNIRLYENGYAFINDPDGNIIYHPRITDGERQTVPDGLLSDDTYIQYTYGGVEKQAVWLPLLDGTRLNVTVPVSEINGEWQGMIYDNFSASVFLLVVFVLLTMQLAGQITAPLQKLTEAAKEVNTGNYDFELEYSRNDEVGILTQAFRQLVRYLKTYISDLNDMAYADALTSVHNKGAFDIYARELQTRIDAPDENLHFAVGVFDCDNLKFINDQYGHDKGDTYLKTATNLICRVFKHSPVFRTGGDEFTVIMQNEDYEKREELIGLFWKQCAEACASAAAPWEEVHVSVGIDAFDPETDALVSDVVRRADKLMYENKRSRKAARR